MNTPDPSNRTEFADFWSQRYFDANEALYTENINSPDHTIETLTALFKWKIGPFRFKRLMALSVHPIFLSNIEKAKAQPKNVSAEQFLAVFPNGGAIHRIFWLHCWRPHRFPIYDQHVHRAMLFIQAGEIKELDLLPSDEHKIARYLTSYIPFYETFADGRPNLHFDPKRDGIPTRKIDRALVTFGSAIKIPKRQ